MTGAASRKKLNPAFRMFQVLERAERIGAQRKNATVADVLAKALELDSSDQSQFHERLVGLQGLHNDVLEALRSGEVPAYEEYLHWEEPYFELLKPKHFGQHWGGPSRWIKPESLENLRAAAVRIDEFWKEDELSDIELTELIRQVKDLIQAFKSSSIDGSVKDWMVRSLRETLVWLNTYSIFGVGPPKRELEAFVGALVAHGNEVGKDKTLRNKAGDLVTKMGRKIAKAAPLLNSAATLERFIEKLSGD